MGQYIQECLLMIKLMVKVNIKIKKIVYLCLKKEIKRTILIQDVLVSNIN
jgi:hypothetical protein